MKIKNILFLLVFCLVLLPNIQGAVGGLSQATIQSNYFDFDKAWVVDFVSDDFTTDKISAYFTPDDFENAGQRTIQSLSISANTKPTSCQWSLKEDFSTNPDVYLYAPFTASKWTTNIDNAKVELSSQCARFRSIGTNYYAETFSAFGSGKVTIWCLKAQEKLGTVGNFLSPFTLAETDWEVTVEGKEPQRATISNDPDGGSESGRSEKVGDRVWIQWQGDLSTGEECPSTANAIPIHSNTFASGWKVASEGRYDSYKNYFESSAMTDIRNWADGIISKSSFERTLTLHANNAIFDYADFGSFSVLDSDVGSGKIKVDLGRQISFPQFRLIIDADYLELEIPTGKPELSKDFLGRCSVGKVDFTEGSSGTLNIGVKNAGEGEGGFSTRIIECSNGFSSNTQPIGSTLNPGEAETLSFEIIGSTTIDQSLLSGSCKVEMKESVTGEIDICTFSTELTQIRECPPPESACGVDGEIHVIKECNSQGTGLEIVDRCGAEEICVETTGGPECKPKISDEDGFCVDCDAYAKNLLFGWFSDSDKCEKKIHHPVTCLLKVIFLLLKTLAIPLFFLGSLFFGVQILNKLTARKFVWLSWLVSFILAIFVGVATYFLFWLGFIIFVVYILFRIFTGFIPTFRTKKFIRRK